LCSELDVGSDDVSGSISARKLPPEMIVSLDNMAT